VNPVFQVRLSFSMDSGACPSKWLLKLCAAWDYVAEEPCNIAVEPRVAWIRQHNPKDFMAASSAERPS